MTKVYVLGEGRSAKALKRLRCKDEGTELQDLLENNPQLLPSEQIYPDNPPQWLLIKREMPVLDPSTGAARWSIDFLYVDHMAIPTLVECKRCDDTRSRREVIAQMLEYAANGHHYWSAEELQAHAQESSGGLDQLNSWITQTGAAGGTSGAFFEAVVANLRKATMRLIFFLEESPNELRSLVEFLNNQLKETEVLLVEARLYDSPSGQIIVPWLFGYSEEAKVAKRESRSQATRQTSERGEGAFRAAVESSDLPSEVRDAILVLLDAWPPSTQGSTGWTFGVNAIFMVPDIMRTRGLFHLARNGDIQLYFGYWNPDAYSDVSAAQISLKNDFSANLAALFGMEFTDKQMRSFPSIRATQWISKLPEVLSLIRSITTQHAPPATDANPVVERIQNDTAPRCAS